MIRKKCSPHGGWPLRILYVHKTTSQSLGDGIREQAILSFLKKSPKHFNIHDLNLPIPRPTLKGFVNSISFSSPTSTLFQAYKALGDLRLAAMFNCFHNRIIRVLRREAFDVIISETTPIGWLTSKLLRQYHISVPHIVDVHGLWFAEEGESGGKTWREMMLKEMETLHSATRIFVVSNAMKDFIRKIFAIENEKMILVSNGAPGIGEVSQYCLPFRVIYAGIFASYENLSRFLELAKTCDDPRIQFTMAGTGPIVNRILREMKRGEIPIRYLGYVPRNAMLRLLAHFQVGVIFSKRNTARKVAFPIKILDYASRGLPVISPRIGDWGQFVESKEIGFSVEGSVGDYMDAIHRLMNRRLWLRKSQNAILFARRRQWSNVLQPIHKCL